MDLSLNLPGRRTTTLDANWWTPLSSFDVNTAQHCIIKHLTWTAQSPIHSLLYNDYINLIVKYSSAVADAVWFDRIHTQIVKAYKVQCNYVTMGDINRLLNVQLVSHTWLVK